MATSRIKDFLVVSFLLLPVFFGAVYLLHYSGFGRILEITQWFDPLFFQYNILMWALFVLLIPAVTYFYNHNMKEERRARLQSDLNKEWDIYSNRIIAVINRQFGMPNYIGSTLTLMLVVSMGLAVLLLAKPLSTAGLGLDYSKGANLFLLGANIGIPITSPEYFERIVISLAAFQFGFLGAYVYFMQHLVRSYFTLDLTPNTFVAMSIRMITAGLVALVLSYALQELPYFEVDADKKSSLNAWLPLISFFIGLAPARGILIIEELVRKIFLTFNSSQSMNAIELSNLSGMSRQHMVRLRREGYDNVENIARANSIEMAVRTGFGYEQLRSWVGEAWLRTHLGKDYELFFEKSGIQTADQLKEIAGENGLIESIFQDEQLRAKVSCITQMLEAWNPND